MKTLLKIFGQTILFVILTILTQIGGIVYLISSVVHRKVKWKNRFKPLITFVIIYNIFTFLIVPMIAPMFGRERVKNSDKIHVASYFTIICNRNYVRPALNELLEKTEKKLSGTAIQINYLDANFPFINRFPLLPHLSHNDGKKLDLSFVYENNKGQISTQQKSNSGYGVFVNPLKNEKNQTQKCLNAGYFQYDFTKYVTLGSKNRDLVFSKKGTKKLIQAILKNKNLGKLFIEPHLKTRMNLNDSRIRFHGCRAVRHDDHIHIQLK
ncbi:MAG: hypothetical protein ACPG19_13685 [Saprospiraceae bacterium]